VMRLLGAGVPCRPSEDEGTTQGAKARAAARFNHVRRVTGVALVRFVGDTLVLSFRFARAAGFRGNRTSFRPRFRFGPVTRGYPGTRLNSATGGSA
jgi:hypothetical protein